MRIYKPWLHLDFVFAVYTYFTGLRKSYEMVHKLPMQVEYIGLQAHPADFQLLEANLTN